MSGAETDICVIIAAFEARSTIGRAVRSALAQDFVAEVIVVDDASQDGTADAARNSDDQSGRLRIIELPVNSGPAKARNRALDATGCENVCVLDADDYFLPGRITRLLASAPKDWDLLADDIIIMPESGGDVDLACAKAGSVATPIRLDLATFIDGNIPHPRRPRGELGFLKPIIKRSFLIRHGVRYDERLRLGEDYALYARALALNASFYVVGVCGYVAVQRHDLLSSTHSAQDLEQIVNFDDRCLAELRDLSPIERAAFVAHRATTLRRFQYRAILDSKRDGGLLRAFGALARIPDAIPYIASQTIQARLARLGWRLNGGGSDTGPRLLIGATLAQPSQCPPSP